jgi:hypothetical protein
VFNQLADSDTLKLARSQERSQEPEKQDKQPQEKQDVEGLFAFARFLAPREALDLAHLHARYSILDSESGPVVHVCSRTFGLSEFALAQLGFYTDLTLVPGDDKLELDFPEAWPRTGLYAPDRVRVLRGPLGLTDIALAEIRTGLTSTLPPYPCASPPCALFLADTATTLARLACEMSMACALLRPGGNAVLRLPNVLLVALSAAELLWLFSSKFETLHVCMLGPGTAYIVAKNYHFTCHEPADDHKSADTYTYTYLEQRATAPELEVVLDWDEPEPELELVARQLADFNRRVAKFLTTRRGLRKARDTAAESAVNLEALGPVLPEALFLSDLNLSPLAQPGLDDVKAFLEPMLEQIAENHFLLARRDIPGTTFVFVCRRGLYTAEADGDAQRVRRLHGDLASCMCPGMVLHVYALEEDLTRLRLLDVLATADQPFLWKQQDEAHCRQRLLDRVRSCLRPQALVSLE